MSKETLEQLAEYGVNLASSGESNLIKRALRDRAPWLKSPQLQEVMRQEGGFKLRFWAKHAVPPHSPTLATSPSVML